MKVVLFTRGQAEDEKIETIIKPFKLDEVKETLNKRGYVNDSHRDQRFYAPVSWKRFMEKGINRQPWYWKWK